MAKTIDISFKPFEGKVILHDPLTLPMVLAFEEALTTSGEFHEEKEVDGETLRVLKPNLMPGKRDAEYVKAILPSVEKWELTNFPENVTAETFPFTPRRASSELVNTLMLAMFEIYRGEVEVPNE